MLLEIVQPRNIIHHCIAKEIAGPAKEIIITRHTLFELPA
jgi:hypothetical protein